MSLKSRKKVGVRRLTGASREGTVPAGKQGEKPMGTRALTGVLALAAAGGLIAAAGGAAAMTTEGNALACPAPGGQTQFYEANLSINETRVFAGSQMMARITYVSPSDHGGFTADILLPTVTLRGVGFYGHPDPNDDTSGPTYRFTVCGMTYEVGSVIQSAGVGNALNIKIIPAGF